MGVDTGGNKQRNLWRSFGKSMDPWTTAPTSDHLCSTTQLFSCEGANIQMQSGEGGVVSLPALGQLGAPGDQKPNTTARVAPGHALARAQKVPYRNVKAFRAVFPCEAGHGQTQSSSWQSTQKRAVL